MKGNILLSLITILYFLQSSKASGQILQNLLGVSLSGKWQRVRNATLIFPLQQKLNANAVQLDISSVSQQNKEEKLQIFIQFFSTVSGLTQVQFYELENMYQNSQEKKKRFLFIRLFENKYIKDRIIEFRIPLDDLQNQKKDKSLVQSQEILKKKLVSARLYQQQKLIVTFYVQAEIILKNITQHQDSIQHFQILLNSDSINLHIKLTPLQVTKKFFYGLLFLNFVQLICLLFAKKNRNILYGTSQWLILHVVFSMMFQALVLVKISLQKLDTAQSLLLINSFLIMAIMLFLLKQYQKVFQKFKNKDLLGRMIIAMILYLYLAGTYYQNPEFWVFQSMLFIWQIVHSSINGGQVGMSLGLLIFILCNRIPILYTLFSEENLIKIKPHNIAGFITIAVIIFHILIIYLQAILGSRFLIPNCLIPDYHNYMKKDFYGTPKVQQECSICLNKLQQSPDQVEDIQEQQNKDQNHEETIHKIQINKQKQVYYAQTPCGHAFHKKCLQDWLETNLVCPMCKRQLPPFSEK